MHAMNRTPGDRPPPSTRQGGRRKPPPELPAFATSDLANALLQKIEDDGLSNTDAAALGLLAAELDFAVSDHNWNRFGAARDWLPTVKQHPDVDGFDDIGGGVIELGAGGLNPIAPLVGLMLRGVTPAYSLDLDPIEREDLCARSAFRTILDVIARLGLQIPASVDWSRLRAGHLDAIQEEHWRFIEAPADRTGLADDSVGLCLSNSFLEHISDVEAAVRESARILRPGGMAIHRIDYSDHRHWITDADPIEFLCEESDAPLVHNCNRLRHHEIFEIFEAAGFEVRGVDVYGRIEVDQGVRKRLKGRFRTMTDDQLSVVFASLFLRLRQ